MNEEHYEPYAEKTQIIEHLKRLASDHDEGNHDEMLKIMKTALMRRFEKVETGFSDDSHEALNAIANAVIAISTILEQERKLSS